MQTHKIIEAIQSLEYRKQISQALSYHFISNIIESAKFHICADPLKFNNKDLHSIYKSVKMPYQLCFFQMLDELALLVWQMNDNSIKFIFFIKENGSWVMRPVLIAFDPISISLSIESSIVRGDSDVIKERWERILRKGKHLAFMEILYSFLAVMNCSNVVCVDNPPDEKLNKKRIKASKVPLFSYKTLHIKTGDKERMAGGVTKHGDRVGPRLHLRRGHIRRLTPDRTTWVSSCVVGDEKKGIVMKNYRVTA